MSSRAVRSTCVEHRLEVELRDERPANVEKLAQLRFARAGFPRGGGHVATRLRHVTASVSLRHPTTHATRSSHGGTPRKSPEAMTQAGSVGSSTMSREQRSPVLIGYDGHEDAAAAIHGAGALLGPGPAIVAYVWESLATLLLHADVEQLTGIDA